MPRADELFWETASIDYPIIDADAHVNEPPELWQERVPSRYRARAPKVLHTDDGDVWSFDDGKRLRPLGLTVTAGRNVVEFRPSGRRYDEIRPGSFDTKARLEDMDVDGIYAQIIYPSVTLTGAATYAEERELQLVCVRAYNEWMLEFCEGSDGRLVPQAIIPTTGVKDAVDELRWALEHGHRGVIVSAYPNGTLESAAEDDAFWDVAAQSATPVAIHIGSFTPSTAGGRHPDYDSREFLAGAGATKAGWNAMATTSDLLFSGLFERHPSLRVILVESNIGWIPTFLEQTDDMFRRYRFFSKALHEMTRMPSDFFFRNFWATFMMDSVGVENRHHLEIDRLMFSTDYPHSGCDWPLTRGVIEKIFRGVPRDEVKKMLCDNARALYHLDALPERI